MMISDFAIKRPIVTVTVMLALVVFGLFALFRLDTDEFPDVVAPVVTVATIYPGSSPDVVEREETTGAQLEHGDRGETEHEHLRNAHAVPRANRKARF